MPSHPTLQAERREVLGKKVGRLRREGFLPATVYGPTTSPVSIQLNSRDFSSVLRHAGRTGLIDLIIEGEAPRPVFIRATQIEPKRNVIQHVEFLQPNLRQAMVSRVPVHLTGEAPAAKEGGIVFQVLDHVDINSLPEAVPAEGLQADISGLEGLTATMHVSDITPPQGVTIVTPGDEVLVTVTPPVAEEVVEEIIEEVAPTEEEEQQEAASVPAEEG